MEKIWNIGNDQLELDNRNANGIWRAKIVINRIDIEKCIETAVAIENKIDLLLSSYNSSDSLDKDIVLKKKKKE